MKALEELKPITYLHENYSVHKSLEVMGQNGHDYGVILKNGQAFGYVTVEQLEDIQNKDDDISKYCQLSIKEVKYDQDIEDLKKWKEGIILIFKEPRDYIGVLDYEVLIKTIKNLIRELDIIVHYSSDELYVTDGNGNTILVNKAFEVNSGVPIRDVLGKNVEELEKEGIFKPSVTKLVLKEKKQVSIMQEYRNNTKVLVTGTPVFNEDGSIYRVITNSRDTAKLNNLRSQLEELENLKDSYYQELMSLKNYSTCELIIKSPEMKEILNLARKIAEVDSAVLLTGETGVGKGLLARYIHDNSIRRCRSFISINCGAIPENLLESELFGYEPGAFTGANQKGKKGKMELANQGTLFLDEVGELPLQLQVKLLDVIEKGVITRIGGTKVIKLDIRVIAATNQDLLLMINKGCFRKDLYYRLNVLPLEIPPLRNRKAEIMTLAEHFLKLFNQKYRKKKEISPDTNKFLLNYSWPGNVRELENLIERSVIVINEDVIQPYHLPEEIKMESLNLNVTKKKLENIAPLEKIINDIEKNILEKLYKECGNTYKIAQILKVNQSTVVRKLNKYNLNKQKGKI